MRTFIILVGFFLLAVSALAAPSIESRNNNNQPSSGCMTDDQAWRVAQNFQTLVSNYSNATAKRVLSPVFSDYSDSVIELINGGCANTPIPLGSPAFSSRDAYIAGQGSQPNIPFEILNVYHNCDVVTLRYRLTAPGGSNAQFVTGINILETVHAKGSEPWLIKLVYAELNSGAWMIDLGLVVPTGKCPS